jgi:hypothetical protein
MLSKKKNGNGKINVLKESALAKKNSAVMGVEKKATSLMVKQTQDTPES